MNKLCFAIILLLVGEALSFCTIGVAAGSATRDGRPIAFKTRDTNSWSLEFKVQSPDGLFAFVGNTAVDNSIVWFGQNEVGFGITQSAAYNLSGGGSGLGNGSMMNFALARCTTIDDFEHILDSTNTGRATAANYAVFDADGGAAIFECGRTFYARYDADSLGIVVRGNFAYIGTSGRVGQNRMERAYSLIADAIAGDSLDAKFIIKAVLSDLLYPDQDPYPLPWTGAFPPMPAGWLDTGPFTEVQTICNANTHAAGVAQGVAPGEDPAHSLLWCMFGAPVGSVAFPLFPASLSTPSECIGSSSPMFVASKAKYDSLFSHPSVNYWLNAGYLLDTLGGGVLTYTHPIIDWAFDSVSAQLDEWAMLPPSAGDLADFQSDMIAMILGAYTSGTPLAIPEKTLPTEIALSAYPNPFNTAVTLSAPIGAEIEIFDVNGRRMDVIARSDQSVIARSPMDDEAISSNQGDCFGLRPRNDGKGVFIWQPDENIPSGVYLVRATASSRQTAAKRVVYLK